jgi:hypothetical protein
MAKVFISYKHKDSDVYNYDFFSEYEIGEDTNYQITARHYVNYLEDLIGSDHIYKGEKDGESLADFADNTIDTHLKRKIFDSSVTIVLMSPNMFDKSQLESDQWIPNEIAYSLRVKSRNGKTSNPNGILAIALPDRNANYDHALVHKDCGVRSRQTHSFFKIISRNMFNRNNKNHTLCNSCFGYHHN